MPQVDTLIAADHICACECCDSQLVPLANSKGIFPSALSKDDWDAGWRVTVNDKWYEGVYAAQLGRHGSVLRFRRCDTKTVKDTRHICQTCLTRAQEEGMVSVTEAGMFHTSRSLAAGKLWGVCSEKISGDVEYKKVVQ